MTSTASTASRKSLPERLSDADLAAFQQLSLKLTGIKLDDAKRSMIYTRFLRRLRTLDLPDFKSYLDFVARPGSDELQHFVNTITTNLTYFYREPHHFEFLAGTVIPALRAEKHMGAPIRAWSAGSSSGEEPYTIAMTFAEAGLEGNTDYKLLCTDIDTNMVQRTREGCYPAADVRGLSAERATRWFDKDGEHICAKQTLQQGMICRPLNLFGEWPIRPGIDIIFCRNVLIYFVREDQDKIIATFAGMQNEGGFLFLGHSESLRGLEHLYDRVDNTVYRRTANR